MRKYILAILVFIGMALGILVSLNRGVCPFRTTSTAQKIEPIKENDSLNRAFILLKNRKDNDALVIFQKALASRPDNLDALWGRAEVLRRSRDYGHSGELLNKILSANSQHAPSLISLGYIKYKDDKLKEALNLISRALKTDCLDRENRALAYMMLGSINSKRSERGWFFSKVAYGTHIKWYFLKARELAPDLPEAHLGLGTFYLLAPAIVGGNLDKAIEELEFAVKIAPDFATANARLAQAHSKKGDLERYNFYIRRTRELDPENEVLKEIEEK